MTPDALLTTLLILLSESWYRLDGLWLTIPLMVILELPLLLMMITGVSVWAKRQARAIPTQHPTPGISCIVTCYSEGDRIRQTAKSLCEQWYSGHIEILLVIDGASQNPATYQAALACQQQFSKLRGRTVRVLPKWQRSGRVSSCNTGLYAASHDLVLALDGDSSFDNDMISQLVLHFADPDVPAVAGSLRVRNARAGVLTRMQAIEYMLSIQLGRTGLGHWNFTNNISGAFGAFRGPILKQIGGWDTHTAEDYDITIRLKQYFGRYSQWKIPFATCATGETDAPATLMDLIRQRLRWEGDLAFILLRKHRHALNPRLLGWPSYLFTLLSGVVHGTILPLLISFSLLWILITLPWRLAAVTLLLSWLGYLLLSAALFTLYLVAISGRPRQDAALYFWLPLYPPYTLFLKLVTTFALANEWLRHSHRESSMAPHQVLNRAKKF